MKNTKYIILYILGVIIIIAGLVIFIISLINMIKESDDGSHRFVVPGEATIEIQEPGKYIVYYEYESTVDGVIYSTRNADLSGLRVWIFDSNSNSEFVARHSTMTSTYSINGRSGTSVLEFVVPEATTIVVETEYDSGDGPDVVLNISKEMVGIMFKGMGVPFAYLFGSGSIGFLIVVLTIIFHIKARRKYKRNNVENSTEIG